MIIEEYADREMLAMNVANVLAGALKKALQVQDQVSFAVPGGSTPGPVFDLLSATELEWERVHVMLTDERWVPEDDQMSNARLLRARLLVGPAARAGFMPFYRDGMAAGQGSAAQADALAPFMPLSVLMLGMGADMHTASLFPGAEGLDAAFAPAAPLLMPIAVPDAEVARVTLPAHALDGALAKHLVIFGDDKRAALDLAQSLPPEKAPVAAVLGGATVHWAA